MGSSVVLLGDQLPVPSQQGLRRDNVGDLGKNLSSQRFGLYGQSPALIVIQAQSPAAELLSKNSILLAKVINDLQLVLVHPAGDGDQQESEWVKDSLGLQSPLSQPRSRSTEPPHLHADPVFGPYGTVKLLDFGLAKSTEETSGNLSNSPTISLTMTQVGVILGTAAYMSPEQARGKSVDKRADIWAFGVVLFEMLTG